MRFLFFPPTCVLFPPPGRTEVCDHVLCDQVLSYQVLCDQLLCAPATETKRRCPLSPFIYDGPKQDGACVFTVHIRAIPAVPPYGADD